MGKKIDDFKRVMTYLLLSLLAWCIEYVISTYVLIKGHYNVLHQSDISTSINVGGRDQTVVVKRSQLMIS